jgi:hypothetical protein
LTRFEAEWDSEQNIGSSNMDSARQVLRSTGSKLLDYFAQAERLYSDNPEVGRILQVAENRLRTLAAKHPEKELDFRYASSAFWQEGFDILQNLLRRVPS